LTGLPARARPGARYRAALTIDAPEIRAAAFLIRAECAGVPSGRFAPLDDRTEAVGAAIRSTAAGLARSSREARWNFRWTAPSACRAGVVFFIAANVADDDASPFGDEIYLDAVVVGVD
jgi:hypothetical protein